MKPLILGLAFFILAGCVPAPTTAPSGDGEARWMARRAQLACRPSWEVQGRVGLVANGEGWTARLTWRQEAERYSISLNGPLGTGGVRIDGDQRLLTVQSAGETRYFEMGPEDALWQVTGQRLPLEGLRYWLLGVDAPGSPSDPVWDDKGRLRQLTQDGWTIQYLAYRSAFGWDLPSRLAADRSDVRIKLVIQDWVSLTTEACAP
ncbi:MAG: lipoprotein insertase outer membrane protein LolB [Pseudomonadota bacterium]|nr:lipoprotein insertase outer membrane protein LolB [Pseudomonadota bacterium]